LIQKQQLYPILEKEISHVLRRKESRIPKQFHPRNRAANHCAIESGEDFSNCANRASQPDARRLPRTCRGGRNPLSAKRADSGAGLGNGRAL
jgi:hypothetical protein